MSIFSKIFNNKPDNNSGLQHVLNAHYVSKNGLYRKADDSVPSLEEFQSHGFNEDEYFKLVHGASQSELQNELMLPIKANRHHKVSVMNHRIALNKRKAQPKQIKQEQNDFLSDEFSTFSMFAPYGVYNQIATFGLGTIGFLSITSGNGIHWENLGVDLQDNFGTSFEYSGHDMFDNNFNNNHDMFNNSF